MPRLRDFPSAKCWLKSLELFIVTIPVAFLTLIFAALFGMFHQLGGEILLPAYRYIPYKAIAYLIVFLFSSFLFACYFGWGKDEPPRRFRFLPSKNSYIEGVFMSCASIIAYFSTWLLIDPFMSEQLASRMGYHLGYYKRIDSYSFLIIAIYLTFLAHLYHLRDWIKSNRK